MKRRLTWLAMLLLACSGALIAVQIIAEDPETSNIADSDDMPSFYVSDPTLLEPGPHSIQERFPNATEWRSGAETPYFLQLADGRFACGYTNASGKTTLLFTKEEVDYKVFWDEEAWRQWRIARRASNQ